MRRRIRTVLLVLATVGVCCAGTWKQDGKPVPDTPWARSDGDFGAQLVFTDKPDELFAAWERPGASVYYSQTPTAVRGGGPIVGVIFFAGCATNEGGNCELLVDFQGYRPDGKPWGEAQHGEVWLEKPAPSPGEMQLGIGAIGLKVEPADPLGEYKVRADILDRVTGKHMVLERTFTAVEGDKKRE